MLFSGSNKCRLRHFPKNKDLHPEQWFNPDYAKEKVNQTAVVVISQYLAGEKYSSDSETVMVFSGAQTIKFEDVEDPEVIWDSGSTITLENLLEDIKGCDLRMFLNGGSRNIEKEVNWPGFGQSYLHDEALVNSLSK